LEHDVENGVLNVARHSIRCSMRFSSMWEEWALLWIHYVWRYDSQCLPLSQCSSFLSSSV
jgi:hypothetical protein